MNEAKPERYTGLLGVGGAVLTIAGVGIMSVFAFMDPADEIATAVADDSARVLAGAQITVIGFLLLAAFGIVLRRRMRAAGSEGPLADVIAGGYATAAAAGLVGAVALVSVALRADEDGSVAAGSASAIGDLGMVVLAGAVPAALALGVGAAAIAALRGSALLPRWMGWIGIVLAVGMVILPISYVFGPLGLLWTAGAGLTLSWNAQPVTAVPTPAAA